MNDHIVGIGLIGIQCIILLIVKGDTSWKEWFNCVTLNKFTKQKLSEVKK